MQQNANRQLPRGHIHLKHLRRRAKVLRHADLEAFGAIKNFRGHIERMQFPAG